jgi:hypothetical protein
MPGGEQVSSVVYISSYFILTVLASQHFFWLAPGDVNPDPLNFASFESSSDNIIAAVRLLDEVWFFGESTTEIYNLTGDLNLPFQPIAGRLYEKGCANKSSIAVLDNTLFWVGNDLIVYRADTAQAHQRSQHGGTASVLPGPNDLRAWALALMGTRSIACSRRDARQFHLRYREPKLGPLAVLRPGDMARPSRHPDHGRFGDRRGRHHGRPVATRHHDLK